MIIDEGSCLLFLYLSAAEKQTQIFVGKVHSRKYLPISSQLFALFHESTTNVNQLFAIDIIHTCFKDCSHLANAEQINLELF